VLAENPDRGIRQAAWEERLRSQHIAAMTGIVEVRSWDLFLPSPGFTTPRMSLDQTRATALARGGINLLGPVWVYYRL
jgi:hypothetical protein